MGELIPDEVESFLLSKEELDWYIDELWNPVFESRKCQDLETTREHQWTFRGIKLTCNEK